MYQPTAMNGEVLAELTDLAAWLEVDLLPT
jgi:hypothetical protein